MKGIGNGPKGELEIGELEIECGCADAQQYPLQHKELTYEQMVSLT